jgi:hypothetical protein
MYRLLMGDFPREQECLLGRPVGAWLCALRADLRLGDVPESRLATVHSAFQAALGRGRFPDAEAAALLEAWVGKGAYTRICAGVDRCTQYAPLSARPAISRQQYPRTTPRSSLAFGLGPHGRPSQRDESIYHLQGAIGASALRRACLVWHACTRPGCVGIGWVLFLHVSDPYQAVQP